MSKILATPAVRKAAGEKGIDLSSIKGSGEFGAIILKDIENVSASSVAKEIKVTPLAKNIANYYGIDAEEISNITKKDVMNVVSSLNSDSSSNSVNNEEEISVTKYSGIRKTIGENMMNSLSSMAQYTNGAELDVTKLMELYKDAKQTYKENGKRLTITDLLIKIVSITLMRNPVFNQTFEKGEIKSYPYVNMGLAVAADNGLIVPTIYNSSSLSLSEISSERAKLVDKARNNKLKPDEYKNATFTISSLGNSPVTYFTPVINPPQVAILGVGRTDDKLVMEDNEVKVKKVCYFSITSDHRVVDGIKVADFFATLKELLADPLCVLL